MFCRPPSFHFLRILLTMPLNSASHLTIHLHINPSIHSTNHPRYPSSYPLWHRTSHPSQTFVASQVKPKPFILPTILSCITTSISTSIPTPILHLSSSFYLRVDDNGRFSCTFIKEFIKLLNKFSMKKKFSWKFPSNFWENNNRKKFSYTIMFMKIV